MIDIINANTYEDMSDHVLVPQDGHKFSSDFLRKGGVIFAKTDFVGELFKQLRFIKHKYVLITHHSDSAITKQMFKSKPPCIVKWFALNVQFKHPDLLPIPFGLYTHKGFSKNVWVDFNFDKFEENIKNLQANEKDPEVVYCNWTGGLFSGDGPGNVTNGYRFDIPKFLDDNGVKYIYERGLSFEQYSENMSRHKFVISPPGNAPQGTTTWEALHYGCIPIVIDNPVYRACKNLPMIILRNHGDITDRYTNCNGYGDLTTEMLKNYDGSNDNYDTLYLSYWKKMILSHLN